MKRRHDRPFKKLFGIDALRIHGNIAQVSEDTEQEKSRRKMPRLCRQSQIGKRKRIKGQRKEQYPMAAVFGDELARKRHDNELTERQGKQNRAQVAFAQVQRSLDVWDTACPSGKAQSHRKIKKRDRPAYPFQVRLLGVFVALELRVGIESVDKSEFHKRQ
ncbi:hypothetical protein D9M72_416070 [compost metagenome]